MSIAVVGASSGVATSQPVRTPPPAKAAPAGPPQGAGATNAGGSTPPAASTSPSASASSSAAEGSAAEEAQETYAQTLAEAAKGDPQAMQKLVAEDASKTGAAQKPAADPNGVGSRVNVFV